MAEKDRTKLVSRSHSLKLREPPFINLDEAMGIARDIYGQGGGKLSREDLQPILQNRPTSSWFRMKLYALKSFGLIEDPRAAVIELTQLALSILAPQSVQERAEAKLKALSCYSPFRDVAERYLHKGEPHRSFVENIFERELNIPGNKKAKWAQCFIGSARAAGLFRAPLEIKSHDDIKPNDNLPPIDISAERQQETSVRQLSTQEKARGWLVYEIPVSGGERPRIIIPPGLKRKDFEKIKKVLEALAPEEGEDVPWKEN